MRYIILILLLSSCSTLTDFFFPGTEDKDANVEWMKDLIMTVNGVTYRGIANVKQDASYEIKVYPSEDRIDRLQWRTCHREDFADKAVKYSMWPWSKKEQFFKMNFQPRPIELERACPLMFEALAEKHKTMSFGMIIFPDRRPHVSVEANLECNGKTIIRRGTSECQAPVDSIHKIRFSGEVIQDDRPNKECPPMKKVQDGLFEFFMPKNMCIYIFMSPEKDQSGKFKIHKLITYGYEKIPPPKGA